MQKFGSKLVAAVVATAICAVTASSSADVLRHLAPDGVFKDGSIVLFIGDSITHGGRRVDMNHYLGHGYQAEVAARYLGYRPEKGLCFLNRAISGDDTERLLARWEKDVFNLKFDEKGWRSPFPKRTGILKPDVVSLLVGINDFHHGKKNKGLTLEKYAANLETLVSNTLARLPGVEMVICEPFTIYGPEIEEFTPWRKAAREVAERHGLCFVDFQRLFSETLLKEIPRPGYWFWDSAHPTYAAHIRMADYWIEKVAEHRRRIKSSSARAAIVDRGANVFTLEGPVRTNLFRQADFKWMVTPRHDYSKTYVTKLFLSQAEFEREHLGKFKMRDNGKQTVRMTYEQAFEAIKGMDEISLGLPKIVYLVGWQYNGHDSKYPAFFEGNRKLARACDKDPLDSVRWLMREGKKYHTAVSLHINLFDAYDDSPLFDEYVRADVLAKDKDGKFILGDWAYKVDYASEFAKGLLQKRVDRLCSLLPVQEAGTIHVDAFHSSVPLPYVRPDGKVAIKFVSPISPWHGGTHEKDIAAKKNIVKYFDSKGIDITTEGVDGMDVGGIVEGWFPMYWHYGSRDLALSLKASQACGGNVYGSQCAFGRNVNGEQLFMGNPDIAKALDLFKGEFCKTVLICQYLNTFGRKGLIEGKNGSIGVFEGGVRTMWKGGRLSVAKDGEVLCDGSDLFIPAVWLGDDAVVAYSERGCRDRKWKIPSGTRLAQTAKAWTINASGRKPFTQFSIDGETVTITLAPNEMVLIQ